MDTIRFLRHTLFHFIIVIIILFLAFGIKENDMGTMFFVIGMYLPYVVVLILLNFLLITVGKIIFSKPPLIFLTSLFINVALTIWYMVKGKFQVGYWQFSFSEFIALNSIFLVLNLISISTLTPARVRNSS